MELKRVHHVAYRCKDAKETVDFYQRVLNMDFTVGFPAAPVLHDPTSSERNDTSLSPRTRVRAPQRRS